MAPDSHRARAAGRLQSSCIRVAFGMLLPSIATLTCVAAEPVDLQLVLAVDASGSVDQFRFELQRLGYAAAFRHHRVLHAIRSGPQRSIAVALIQWTGPTMQVKAVDWTRIADPQTAASFADAIERAPRQLFGGGTSISGALDYAATLFPISPFPAARRVIDI